ncbi:MAG: succinate--CoA ligase subunit alpha [Chlamydia sp.]
MPILMNSSSRLLFQGEISESDSFYLQQMITYRTKLVGGVGVRDKKSLDLPVFDSVRDAVRFASCNVSIIFSPAIYAADSILEAIESEIPLIICTTENIPLHDMVEVKRALLESNTSRLIGPGSSGIITAGEAKAGVMPGYLYEKGSIGIISRSGTLAYEAVAQITQLGLGQSTHVVLGNSAMVGSSFIDILQLFEQDLQTEGVLLVGEMDGCEEALAASWIKKHATKPIAAYIAGRATAFQKPLSSKASKNELLLNAGVYITENPAMMGKIIASAIEKRRIKR